MHTFIRRHIVRGVWKDRLRPVLLNSWEANYFQLTERSLLRLAESAKDIGIELFVVDDGWFGERNDDTSSLGDWSPNRKKLPGGLLQLAEKINELGMMFGLWVEPEMVNVDSLLYEAHPDWTLEVPGQPHSEGRQQRILDLTNPIVQEHVIEAMSQVFSSANIQYVKWDMNRIMSDAFSSYLPAVQMGETAHRYICGLYHILDVLTRRFPNILFEGCAAGGNRFDLGMLCYFPQIWASDNTDAYSRAVIQNGYSYGYPQSVYTSHVSDSPNHQTLRVTPLHTRFNVAAFGILGYECNLTDLPRSVRNEMREGIAQYKEWRDVFQQGTFYRIHDFEEGDITSWCIVSPDKRKAVGLLMQGIAKPQQPSQVFRAKGLDPNCPYLFYSMSHEVDLRDFGSLINVESPVHIRPGSLIHQAANSFVHMPGATEDMVVYGDLLMENGIQLKQPFRSTGYNEDTRVWKDFESRLYFMEMIDTGE